MTKKNKITVVGSGYVGMSLSVLLAQQNDVTVFDVDPVRVEKINKNQSTVVDSIIQLFLDEKELSLKASLDKKQSYEGADFVVIATPTNYDVDNDYFDTKSIEGVISDALFFNPDANIVIKSTVPIGYTANLKKSLNCKNILFSPEFLREGKALHDNLHPSRVIVGDESEPARYFANLLLQGAIKKDIDVLFMDSTEAEAVKLFSNTYLAMRVSFFNELDTFAELNKLDTRKLIQAISLDPRIGNHYNNPSFGYGGYCLPKDTKQLKANFKDVPNSLISAIVDSNSVRKDFITESIIKKKPKVVGIHRLIMKNKSDNYRSSSIRGIIKRLKESDVSVVVYEPMLEDSNFFGSKVILDLNEFKKISNLIITNRMAECLQDVKDKVYTRDLFNSD